ncbi:MAG: HEPN domain-containing protein [Kiritimatiellae bacterium]|nr:HEPN domain-containing protein [Kiritimatiellia bacterium]
MSRRDETEANRWLEEAQSDLDTARYLADGRRFNTACFVAQQAAGKAVKAFLYSCRVEQPWGHSVATLLADAVTFDETLENILGLGAALDKYHIPTRYPNGLPGGVPSRAYVAADAEQAITAAERVIEAMRERIRKQGSG